MTATVMRVARTGAHRLRQDAGHPQRVAPPRSRRRDSGVTTGSGAPRPRLLFLSQTLPYPPDGGVKIRTYNILKILAGAYDVTALCFYRAQNGVLTRPVEECVTALSDFGRIEAFPIPQEHSRLRLLADHARSVLTRRSYTVASYESAAYRRRLEELLDAENFDLVHADSLDLSGYFPPTEARGLPIACTHHDVQSSLLSRRADQEHGWRRAYIRHQPG